MLMKFKYEKEFREAHPETTGEKDSAFDLCNYTEWLETIVSRVELPVKPEIAEEKLAEEMAEEVADVMMNFDENINYDNILNSWKAYFINKLKEKG